MKSHKNDNFNDRIKNAAQARRAQLDKLKKRPKADDPEVLKRQAERQAVAEAREIRAAERAETKKCEEAASAEREAQEAVERAAQAEREEQESLALKAEKKAARDARYAARKNRK